MASGFPKCACSLAPVEKTRFQHYERFLFLLTNQGRSILELVFEERIQP